jgi:hypothetical protein
MRKQLLILIVVISFSVIACNGRPDITDSTPEGTTAGGGSVTHTDSLKTINPAINSGSGNTVSAAASNPGNSIAFPADSARQKNPLY